MVATFVILAFAVTVCHAAPFSIIGPAAVYRQHVSPNVVYTFPQGDSQAYSRAITNNGGASYAQGIASTASHPSRRIYNVQPAAYQPVPVYYSGLSRNYGSAVSSAQNFGNFGTSVAQSNAAGQGSSLASSSNLRGLGYGSSISSANSNNGFGSALSSANNSGYGTAVSSAQTRGGLGDYSSAVSASQNVGGVRASTSHAVQQSGSAIQHSGATSIDAPGIQSAYSHAVNNGYY